VISDRRGGTDPRADELRIETVEDLDVVRTQWAALAELGGNIFGTWEWCESWRRHLAPAAETAVALVRRGNGAPLGILPLYVAWQSPVRLVRFLGAGPSDEMGPICAAADRPLVALALAEHVQATLGDRGVFLGEHLQPEHGFDVALPARTLSAASCPVVRPRGRSFDDYLATRSRNFRSQVGRRERQLIRDHNLVFRLCDEQGRLAEDMATLFRLHQARWSAGDSVSFAGPRAAFHLEFAQRAFDRGWLRLWIMELDGQPVAAWHGFRFAGVESYYQAGRDPAFDDLSVGSVLLSHTIRAAFEDGMREYSFGLGDETYKGRFAEDDPGLKTVVFATGAIGDLTLVGINLALRLPPWARTLARRYGG
jgi:CelD/BcsL family acetyltransferase involved in cellulose biosynthesis